MSPAFPTDATPRRLSCLESNIFASLIKRIVGMTIQLCRKRPGDSTCESQGYVRVEAPSGWASEARGVIDEAADMRDFVRGMVSPLIMLWRASWVA